MKICHDCKEEKDDSEYRVKKKHDKNNGKTYVFLDYICRNCNNKRKGESAKRNRTSCRLRGKRFREKHHDDLLTKEKLFRQNNKEKLLSYHKQWREGNIDHVRECRIKINNKRRKSDNYNESDEYVKGLISCRFKISTSTIPEEFIETYRESIKVKRLLKQIKNGKESTEAS